MYSLQARMLHNHPTDSLGDQTLQFLVSEVNHVKLQTSEWSKHNLLAETSLYGHDFAFYLVPPYGNASYVKDLDITVTS